MCEVALSWYSSMACMLGIMWVGELHVYIRTCLMLCLCVCVTERECVFS